MADFENQIRSTILQGYNSFKGLNEEIIAWWLYKLYKGSIQSSPHATFRP